MSFLSTIRGLYKNLTDALKWAHRACRIANKINDEIQASNADAALKTAAAAFVTQAETLCTAIETFRDNLPGN